MDIPKPSDQDKAYFADLFGEYDVEVKPMFGNLAAFVNGNMCAGLFGSAIGVRLPAEHREALRAEPGAGAFGPADRPMKEYVAMPLAWRDDPELTHRWLERAIAHTAALPPKVKKAKKRR